MGGVQSRATPCNIDIASQVVRNPTTHAMGDRGPRGPGVTFRARDGLTSQALGLGRLPDSERLRVGVGPRTCRHRHEGPRCDSSGQLAIGKGKADQRRRRRPRRGAEPGGHIKLYQSLPMHRICLPRPTKLTTGRAGARQGMNRPLLRHMTMLKRAKRYVVGLPRCVHVIPV